MEGDIGTSSVKFLSAPDEEERSQCGCFVHEESLEDLCRIHEQERSKCGCFVHEDSLEDLCRIHEQERSTCGCFVHEESLEISMVEESCDSESVMDSDGTFGSFNTHFAVGFNELDRLFIADDEESTTSSREELSEEEVYWCGEMGEPIAENCLDYLKRASDEELGIPCNHLRIGEDLDLPKPTVFDLDFDVDGCRRKMADEDQQYWLSCLRS